MTVTHRHRRSSERGTALLTVIIVISVLSVVAAGMVRRAHTEAESSTAKRHYDTSVSCAEGAREMLVGYFQSYGVNVNELRLNTVVGDRRYVSGHYDTDITVSAPEGVNLMAAAPGSSTENAFDLANRSVRTRLGGSLYSVTVTCRDKDNPTRQSEIEYVVRFGL